MKSLFSFACGLFAGVLLYFMIVKQHPIIGAVAAFVLFILAQVVSHILHMIMKTRYEASRSYYDSLKW